MQGKEPGPQAARAGGHGTYVSKSQADTVGMAKLSTFCQGVERPVVSGDGAGSTLGRGVGLGQAFPRSPPRADVGLRPLCMGTGLSRHELLVVPGAGCSRGRGQGDVAWSWPGPGLGSCPLSVPLCPDGNKTEQL